MKSLSNMNLCLSFSSVSCVSMPLNLRPVEDSQKWYPLFLFKNEIVLTKIAYKPIK